MKPPFFRALGLAAVAAFLPLETFAAPGDLDLNFEPEVEPGKYGWVNVIGQQIYLYNSNARPIRLLEDGGLDAAWTLAAPADSDIAVFGALPWGGWYVTKGSRLYLEREDHAFTLLSGGTTDLGGVYPQHDGSVVVVERRGTSPQIRFTKDATVDLAFEREVTLAEIDSAGGSSFGGPIITSAADSAGRLILGGNFRYGADERLALARVLPDGTLDPSWNPAPAAGFTVINDGEFMTGFPNRITVGPDDSVYVHASFEDEPGNRVFRILRISAGGEVTGSFHAETWGTVPPVVQPDGRIIICGDFGSWQGTPAPGIVRLNTDGSLDETFRPELARSTNRPYITSAVLDQLGRLLIVGRFDSVNGEPRPGVARLFAYEPAQTSPALTLTPSQPRIGTNEVLHLTAQVTGTPLPDLQWYRNGEPIPGATHRGLALPVTAGDSLGSFQLVASNALGTTTVDFPPVTLARRSPRPGATEAEFDVVLTGFGEVRAMVAQEDGRILVGSGSLPADPLVNVPLVGRLLPDGSWDGSFGSNGIVAGRGIVANLRVLADGHILVAGHLLRVAGAEVSGLAELDGDGSLVPRAFPVLDVPHTTAALRLPNGGYVVAGRFQAVGGQAAFRLARLRADLSVETEFSSPLEYWQLVDDLAHDNQGRLLIAGSGVYLGQPGSITNPAPLGVWRLDSNGFPDPAFQRDLGSAQKLTVEPAGTILVGFPPRRLSDSGQVVTIFETTTASTSIIERQMFSQDIRQRMIFTLNGGVFHVTRRSQSPTTSWSLHRWLPAGALELAYEVGLAAATPGSRVAAVELADQSLLLATFLTGDSRLLRIPPDSDLRLENPRLVDGDLRADLLTQPGRNYVVRQRATLSGPAGEPVAELTGDGYLQEVQAEAAGNTGFLELLRE